jgi:hypothetical protein
VVNCSARLAEARLPRQYGEDPEVLRARVLESPRFEIRARRTRILRGRKSFHRGSVYGIARNREKDLHGEEVGVEERFSRRMWKLEGGGLV